MTIRSILLLAFACGTSLADNIYAKQGSSPMAKDVIVLEQTSDKIHYLDKRLKKRALSMAMVGRVEKKRCVVHEYKDKEAVAKTADDFMALAEWAKSKKFHRDVLRLTYERALAVDPNHVGANLALGRVQYKGEWMTPVQRTERMGQDADAAKRAKGLVQHNGEWITAEDKARLERGLVKYKGAWMTQDQMKHEQGYVKHDGKWVKKDHLAVLKLVGPAATASGSCRRNTARSWATSLPKTSSNSGTPWRGCSRSGTACGRRPGTAISSPASTGSTRSRRFGRTRSS